MNKMYKLIIKLYTAVESGSLSYNIKYNDQIIKDAHMLSYYGNQDLKI